MCIQDQLAADKERDNALKFATKEKVEAFKEKDKAIKEKDQTIADKDQAIADKHIADGKQDEALQEKIKH